MKRNSLIKKIAFLMALIVLICQSFSFNSYAYTRGTEGYFSYYTTSSNQAEIDYCDRSASGKVIIPSKINGYPVVTVSSWCFSECYNITEIVVPEGVEKIHYAGFEDTKLKTITLPSSLTYMSDSIFEGCEYLTDIYYNGAEEEWEKLIGKMNLGYGREFLFANIHFLHNHTGDWIIDNEATCTTAGKRHRICTGCGKYFEENYYKQHNFSSSTCTICGYVDTVFANHRTAESFYDPEEHEGLKKYACRIKRDGAKSITVDLKASLYYDYVYERSMKGWYESKESIYIYDGSGRLIKEYIPYDKKRPTGYTSVSEMLDIDEQIRIDGEEAFIFVEAYEIANDPDYLISVYFPWFELTATVDYGTQKCSHTDSKWVVYTEPTFINSSYEKRICNHCGEVLEERNGLNISYGDSDRDGKLGAKDIVMVRQFITEIIYPTAVQKQAVDLNKDGKIDLKDLVKLKKNLVE